MARCVNLASFKVLLIEIVGESPK